MITILKLVFVIVIRHLYSPLKGQTNFRIKSNSDWRRIDLQQLHSTGVENLNAQMDNYYSKKAFDFWGTRLPKRIKMIRTVCAEGYNADPEHIVIKGREYPVWVAKNGALFVFFPTGRLGIKPSECEIIDWFDPQNPKQQNLF